MAAGFSERWVATPTAPVHSESGSIQSTRSAILERGGGGELTIHGRDGRIRDSDTVPPGRDPHPPKDRK
ncbi:MAG TPA: DUF2188 domain-containing protein [Candidatus Binatia bacterium]|nr:DUF2188 domain-containing protein [Candidatus Binatia bacterium]